MTGGGAAGIWRRFCSVGGVTTEILGLDATSGCSRLQVVVFPGNPGSAAYFKHFMLAVHQQLGGLADVLAVTHAGHDPDTDHGGRLWDLSQQIEHKVAFLREHVLLPGRPPVVLVGHSIGATMMIKAVTQIEGSQGGEQRPQAESVGTDAAATITAMNPLSDWPCSPFAGHSPVGGGERLAAGGLPAILKLVAVFPFFETNFGGNWRQRRLRMLAPWYDMLGWVGATVTSLPRQLQLAFVRLNAAMDPDAVALTAQLLARRTVRQAFFLASHEFKDLSQPWDWSLLRALGSRLHVMGCEADTWMSRQQYEHMLERVPGLQASWHPDLRHAFCISQRQSAAVAEVVGCIARSLPGLPPDTAPMWGGLMASVSAVSVSRAGSSSTSTTTDSSSTTAAGADGATSDAAGTEGASEASAFPSRDTAVARVDELAAAVSLGPAASREGPTLGQPQPGSALHHAYGDDQQASHCHQRRQLHGHDVAVRQYCGTAAVALQAAAAAAAQPSIQGDRDDAGDQDTSATGGDVYKAMPFGEGTASAVDVNMNANSGGGGGGGGGGSGARGSGVTTRSMARRQAGAH